MLRCWLRMGVSSLAGAVGKGCETRFLSIAEFELTVHQKGEVMAHEVRVKIDTAVVAHKDFEVVVRTSDGKLGTLLISKGNIEWLPKGNSVNK